MDILQKIVPFEIKATSNDGATGGGIGNAFHSIDSVGEIVAPGAFLETIPQFLDVGFIGGLNHNWNEPIGKPTDAEEVKVGFSVMWQISDTAHGKDVKILLVDKVVKKLSIGYRVLGSEWLETEDAIKDYWKQHGYKPDAEDKARAVYGARLLTKLHLYEVSPVTVPANRHSDITVVKSDEIPTFESLKDAERFLRDAEFPLSKQAATKYFSQLKALLRDAGAQDTPPIVEASIASLKAEFLRRKARFAGV